MKSLNSSGYSRLVLLAFFALQWQASDAQQLQESKAAARIPFDAANVTSRDGRAFVITWHAAYVHHIRIFAGTAFAKIGRGDALESVRQSMSRSMHDRIAAHPASLNAAFDEVAKDYGSFDNYLHQGLGLSDAALATIRRNFLVE
jgi:hypothetical protein